MADHRFPAPDLEDDMKPGVWQFFDGNHSMERTLRWPPARDRKGQRMALRNPWKDVAAQK